MLRILLLSPATTSGRELWDSFSWALTIYRDTKTKTAGNVYLVVLDKIDYLLTKYQEVLYSIFE